jgi:hypothetical protein
MKILIDKSARKIKKGARGYSSIGRNADVAPGEGERLSRR